ncbi:MAG: hypothetical protein HY657_03425 [Acidobacteria bacterium]|nr:hypothetical protein [Acidobacteriota bacterium]
MHLLQIYLIGYFLLLAGAAWALWRSGILGEIPLAWAAIGVAIAVGLAIVLASRPAHL